ncbi:16S rRNA (cytosine(1402)-N(4))-methyltransferase, partial [Mycoplasmopsis pullorum]
RLDMRMNQDQEIDAYYIVNNYDEVALTQILIKHADVKLAKQVAKAIIKSRPITTTLELVDVIKSAYPAAILRQKNPAKAVFQAIRIEVNDEFNAIHTMLNDSLDLLKPNGHLAIITFHSLEDKIVKNFFGNLIKDKLPSKMPVNEIKNYNARQIKPSQAELLENKRSRSAKLRVLTKIS